MSANDEQIGGNHYRKNQLQPWDVAADWLGSDGLAAFLVGNILKYLCRYRAKNGVEDLKKARHYLDKLIETVENDT